ncbi:unnamed protein product [Urochloa humidicola]
MPKRPRPGSLGVDGSRSNRPPPRRHLYLIFDDWQWGYSIREAAFPPDGDDEADDEPAAAGEKATATVAIDRTEHPPPRAILHLGAPRWDGPAGLVLRGHLRHRDHVHARQEPLRRRRRRPSLGAQAHRPRLRRPLAGHPCLPPGPRPVPSTPSTYRPGIPRCSPCPMAPSSCSARLLLSPNLNLVATALVVHPLVVAQAPRAALRVQACRRLRRAPGWPAHLLQRRGGPKRPHLLLPHGRGPSASRDGQCGGMSRKVGKENLFTEEPDESPVSAGPLVYMGGGSRYCLVQCVFKRKGGGGGAASATALSVASDSLLSQV